MALGCGLRCIKYLLFIFNLLFVLAGIAFIVIGSLAIKLGAQIAWISSPTAVGTFIIVVGVVIFIIAFFGCCGAAKESYCLIVAFTVSLSIIFVLQLAIGIYGVVMKNKIEQQLPLILNSTLNTYTTKQASAQSWDIVQLAFSCCGVNGPNDWQGRLNVSTSVPDSCCLASKFATNCGAKVLANSSSTWGTTINTAGCYNVVTSRLSQSIVVVGISALVLCLVQLLGITCSSCLAHEIHHQYQAL